LPFLAGPCGVLLPPGTGEAIYGFNRALGLKLVEPAACLDYGLFFCSVIRGDEGRYSIVESPDQVRWRADMAPDRVAAAAARIEPPRLSPGDPASLSACVIYAGALFQAEFMIHADGRLEMVSDQPIGDGAMARTEDYSGPIRFLTDQ
jgi:hypothetical protein